MTNYDPEKAFLWAEFIASSNRATNRFRRRLPQLRKEWMTLLEAMKVDENPASDNPIERRAVVKKLLADTSLEPQRRKLLERYWPTVREQADEFRRIENRNKNRGFQMIFSLEAESGCQRFRKRELVSI